jgi:hypothetical protein
MEELATQITVKKYNSIYTPLQHNNYFIQRVKQMYTDLTIEDKTHFAELKIISLMGLWSALSNSLYCTPKQHNVHKIRRKKKEINAFVNGAHISIHKDANVTLLCNNKHTQISALKNHARR